MSARAHRIAASRVFALAIAVFTAWAVLSCGGEDESPPPPDGSEVSSDESREESAPAAPPGEAANAGTTLFVDAQRKPIEQALTEYEAQCAGAATAECKRLQWRLEHALYEDIRVLASEGVIDEELIRVGATADSPQLKAFCLAQMMSRGLAPQEHALVVAAFDDPYPRVRSIAHQLARSFLEERWARMLERDSRVRSDGVSGLIAGIEPSAKSLGAPLYPGATHWHFASSRSAGDFFTTPDAPDDVIAFYAKGGKPVVSAEEIESRLRTAKEAAQNPLLLMQKMQEAAASGEDPAAAMQAYTANAASGEIDWSEGIEGSAGVIEPRYVLLEEEELFGEPVPARLVAIFRDEAMGATALVFRNKLIQPTMPDFSTPESVEAYTRMQQILSTPEASVD